MTRFFPQAFIDDLWAFDFTVAIVAINLTHVLLDTLPQRPAPGMPKHQAWRMVIEVKQIKLASNFSVVAFFCFFEHCDVLCQVFFGRPGRAIDALQHFIVMVAAPISTCHFHQFEMFDPAGAGNVGSTAQIFKRAFAVQTDLLISGDAVDDFSFVVFAQIFKIGHSIVTL